MNDKTVQYKTINLSGKNYLIPLDLFTEDFEAAIHIIKRDGIDQIIEFTLKEEASLISVLNNQNVIVL